MPERTFTDSNAINAHTVAHLDLDASVQNQVRMPVSQQLEVCSKAKSLATSTVVSSAICNDERLCQWGTMLQPRSA